MAQFPYGPPIEPIGVNELVIDPLCPAALRLLLFVGVS